MSLAEEFALQQQQDSSLSQQFVQQQQQAQPITNTSAFSAEFERAGEPAPFLTFAQSVGLEPRTIESAKQTIRDRQLNQLLGDAPLEEQSDVALDLLPIAKIAGGVAGLAALGLGARAIRGRTKAPIDILSGKITPEARNLSDLVGLAPEEVLDLTKGINPQQQARVIAEQSGTKGQGVLKQAISESDINRIAFGESLQERGKQLQDVVGAKHLEGTADAVGEQFDALRTSITNSDIVGNRVPLDTSGMQRDLESLRNQFGGSPIEGKIQGTINRLATEPMNTVDDAVDMYRDLNYWQGKTKRVKDKNKIQAMKNRLKTYVSDNGSESTIQLFDEANKSYRRLKTQEDLVSLIDGAMDKRGIVDWTKLTKDLKKNKLSSPEADAALDLAKEYDKKFGTLDRDLSVQMVTKGEGEVSSIAETGTGFLQRLGVKNVMNTFLDALPTDVGKTRRIQKDIAKAIRDSNTPEEVLAKVSGSEFTPDSVRQLTKKASNAKTQPIQSIDETVPERAESLIGLGLKPTRPIRQTATQTGDTPLSNLITGTQPSTQTELSRRLGL